MSVVYVFCPCFSGRSSEWGFFKLFTTLHSELSIGLMSDRVFCHLVCLKSLIAPLMYLSMSRSLILSFCLLCICHLFLMLFLFVIRFVISGGSSSVCSVLVLILIVSFLAFCTTLINSLVFWMFLLILFKNIWTLMQIKITSSFIVNDFKLVWVSNFI